MSSPIKPEAAPAANFIRNIVEADLAAGVVLSCRIFPTSDLTVRVCPKPTVEPALHPTASAGNDG